MINTKEILQKCTDLLGEGRDIVLVTVIERKGNTPAKPGQKMIVSDSGPLYGTVGGGALEYQAAEDAKEFLGTKKNGYRAYNLAELKMKCGGEASLSFEYMSGDTHFVFFGGGHVASALAPLLETLSFRIVVFDDRKEILEKHEEAGRTVIHSDYGDISAASAYLESGFAFIATQGHAHDASVLLQLLDGAHGFTYLGMIGSKNKIRAAFSDLTRRDMEIPDFLYAPVGLEIGGDSPEEIALSIAAEILAVKYGKKATHMRSTLNSAQ